MSKDRYASRLSAQGYQRPGERPACRNCAHAADLQDMPRSAPLDCRPGGFLCSPMGICTQHAPRPVPRIGGAS